MQDIPRPVTNNVQIDELRMLEQFTQDAVTVSMHVLAPLYKSVPSSLLLAGLRYNKCLYPRLLRPTVAGSWPAVHNQYNLPQRREEVRYRSLV